MLNIFLQLVALFQPTNILSMPKAMTECMSAAATALLNNGHKVGAGNRKKGRQSS